MTITADSVRRLVQDPTFQAILHKVRSDQCEVFLTSHASDSEKREEAHAIIRATNKIEQALQAILTEEAIVERKHKRK